MEGVDGESGHDADSDYSFEVACEHGGGNPLLQAGIYVSSPRAECQSAREYASHLVSRLADVVVGFELFSCGAGLIRVEASCTLLELR
jgi:hypothetical protein